MQNFGGQTRCFMGEVQRANESTQTKRRFCFKSGQQNRQNANILTQIRKHKQKRNETNARLIFCCRGQNDDSRVEF